MSQHISNLQKKNTLGRGYNSAPLLLLYLYLDRTPFVKEKIKFLIPKIGISLRIIINVTPYSFK